MPTYEFFCTKCGKKIPKFYQMNKSPRFIDCPKCKGTMKRLIGAGAGFVFKGEKWNE